MEETISSGKLCTSQSTMLYNNLEIFLFGCMRNVSIVIVLAYDCSVVKVGYNELTGA